MHVVIGIDLWLYLYFLCFYLAILVCMSFVCHCMYIAAVQKNSFSQVLSLNYIQINQPHDRVINACNVSLVRPKSGKVILYHTLDDQTNSNEESWTG